MESAMTSPITPEQVREAIRETEYELSCEPPWVQISTSSARTLLSLAKEGEKMRQAVASLYEWYDRDGSVGGASIVFEENRAALHQEPGAGEEREMNDVQCDSLLAAARALVAKLDECNEPLKSVCIAAHIHGAPYDGPLFGDELEALRALTSGSQSAPDTKGEPG
jgi:hypothetical protein